MNKLFILRPINDWEPWYDKCFGMVVNAETVDEARTIASESDSVGAEGSGAWLDENLTYCFEINPNIEKCVIIHDFASS
jgi:hypothetical protein